MFADCQPIRSRGERQCNTTQPRLGVAENWKPVLRWPQFITFRVAARKATSRRKEQSNVAARAGESVCFPRAQPALRVARCLASAAPRPRPPARGWATRIGDERQCRHPPRACLPLDAMTTPERLAVEVYEP